MNNFNDYMRREEYKVLHAFIEQKGLIKHYRRDEYLATVGGPATKMGIILKGCFRYFVLDDEGRICTMTYGFAGDMVSSYSCMMALCPSVVYIQALDDAEVLEVTYSQLADFYSTNPVLRAIVAEVLLLQTWKEGIEMKSASLARRYCLLKERCPQIEQLLSKKEIAAYLGITPEYFSNMRKKLETAENTLKKNIQHTAE